MSATQKLLRFGVFELNLDTEELRKSGTVIKLPPQPFKLLVLLASHAGQVVDRDEIQEQLWGEETYVDFEHGVNKCIKQIRTVLGDNADNPLYIETLPRHGYRFLAPVVSKTIPAPRPRVVESTSDERSLIPRVAATRPGTAAAAEAVAPSYPGAVPDAEAQAESSRARGFGAELRSSVARVRLMWVGAAVVLLALIGGLLYWRAHKPLALTEKDTIILADFDNQTGDAVFDRTLRQGLSAQLEQSPFLNLLSDDRIAQMLSLMAQPKDARLTGELAREVCQRTASAATIEGSISTLGSQYVVGLKAVNCRTGDLLGEEQVTADRKEQVLRSLGAAATKLRKKLGESLASVQKYDAPPENVTTPSLEALWAYSMGFQRQVVERDYAAAIPFFQRAIHLDPNFAMAYARLGTSYSNLGEIASAAESTRKAYDLRERVSEREKLYIASHYEHFVTGNLEAARKAYELWAQTYLRDYVPPGNLASIYAGLGYWDKAVAAAQETVKLNPASGLANSNLVYNYLAIDDLSEAKATAQQAQAHQLDNPSTHLFLYVIDFLQHDAAGMKHEASSLMGKPGYEDLMLYNESETAAYAGQFSQARELTQRAAESARRAGKREGAAVYEAEGALWEALVGNMASAKQRAHTAVALSDGRDVTAIAATALGLAGDSAQATRIADDLAGRFPEDTIVQFDYLPIIHAAVALQGGRVTTKAAEKAIGVLAAAAPYELGSPTATVGFDLYAIYLRGDAYVAAHQGPAAVTEFQKILDHPGVVANEPIGALAHLGLGRAYALSGDSIKAKAAYQNFLTLWKDADPDIPIYKQAKAEYARL